MSETEQPAPAHVTDEELVAFLATHDREGLTLDELSAHECASIRLAPRFARALAALRAPVDVEGLRQEIEALAVKFDALSGEQDRLSRENRLDPEEWAHRWVSEAYDKAAEMVRALAASSHVERAAQLARENEGLRAEVARIRDKTVREAARYLRATYGTHAHADVVEESVVALLRWMSLPDAAADESAALAAARAEIERLKGELSADPIEALTEAATRVLVESFERGERGTVSMERVKIAMGAAIDRAQERIAARRKG